MDIKDKIKLLKKVKLKNFKSSNLDIEIIGDIEEIDGGIQLFARAFKNGKQLGFGKDGSVEIERFRFFNPPILVDEDNNVNAERKLKEDPEEVIRQILQQAIEVVGKEDTKIKKGKIGNTTSTFYSSTGDGFASRGTTAAWATIIAGAGTAHNDTGNLEDCTYGITASSADSWSYYSRGFFMFDTSAIPDSDNIDSAVFSVWAWNKYTGFSGWGINLVSTTTADPVVNGSYETAGSTALATEIPQASWATSQYNNLTLNTTGEEAIVKDGTTKLCLVFQDDIDGTNPTHTSGSQEGGFKAYFTEQGGTTNDPKFVVEHSASATDNSIFFGNNF